MPLTYLVTAIKRINKGGGFNGRTNKQETGSDYIIYVCPGCQQRNKQSLYQSRYYTPQKTVAFKCVTCEAITEVSLPVSDRKIPLIMSLDDYNKGQAQLKNAMAKGRQIR